PPRARSATRSRGSTLSRGPTRHPRRIPMTTTDTVDPADLVPLEDACEWRSDQLGDSYVFHLTDDHVAELDAALLAAEAQTDDVLDITREQFPLPTLGPELVRSTDDLINGRGVVL